VAQLHEIDDDDDLDCDECPNIEHFVAIQEDSIDAF
jgi:hypothetical protein